MTSKTSHPYEEPFLILLIAVAVIGLFWLFFAFIPAILFAILIATATYPFYKRLTKYPILSTEVSALIAVTAVLSLVILPITYLFIEGGRIGIEVFNQVQAWMISQPQSLGEQVSQLIALLPLPDTWQVRLEQWVINDLPSLTAKMQGIMVHLAGSLFSGITSFITFVAISLFSLFFFYRDGEQFSQRIKNLSPLSNYLDGFIMRRFADLSTVLTISVLGIAILQGVVFGVLMYLLNLPALFLGIAFAIASFIPIVGGLLVWLPVVVYFLLIDQPLYAMITAIYSAVLIGVVIDNFLRPLMIHRLALFRGNHASDKSILSHTWLTMLSTFAGLIHFGVMGLIFGPMLAAMAITIFDVYEHKHRHQLDYS